MPCFLGQIPGADQAIAAAMRTGDWVVVLLVLIVLAALGLLGFMVRSLMIRCNKMEEFINTSLVAALKENSAVIQKMLDTAQAFLASSDDMVKAVEHCRSRQKCGEA